MAMGMESSSTSVTVEFHTDAASTEDRSPSIRKAQLAAVYTAGLLAASDMGPIPRFREVGHDMRGDYVGHMRRTKQTGRNDPCPCNSGKKFKKCCLTK